MIVPLALSLLTASLGDPARLSPQEMELGTSPLRVDPADLILVEDGHARWIDPRDASVAGTGLSHQRPVAASLACLSFVENRGQWQGPARFHARQGAVEAWLCPDELRLRLYGENDGERQYGSVISLLFEGAAGVTPIGKEALAGVHHYWVGEDPSRWATDVPQHAAVVWPELWPGVELEVLERDGRLAYDLRLESGADLSRVRLRCVGALGLALAADGSLLVETEAGELRQSAPRSWAIAADGSQRMVESRFRLLGPDRFGFELPEPTHDALIVDPGLEWSTYLGGAGSDFVGTDLWTLPGGETVCGGLTNSSNFPVTVGAFDQSLDGMGDGWVAIVAADGASLLSSTFFGGNGEDRVRGLAPDGVGGWVIGGNTSSTDLPTSPNVVQPNYGGGGADGFVARFDASLSQLVFATYLGGSGSDFQQAEQVKATIVDPQGTIFATGMTNSEDFPVTSGAFDTDFDETQTSAGSYDGFISRLSLDGTSLIYSTFFGGSHVEYCYDIAVRGSDQVAVGGATVSDNFPTTNGAFGRTYAGQGQDTFLLILRPAGTGASDLIYGSYYSGFANDIPFALAVDSAGRPALTGFTYSDDLPTTSGAWRPAAEAPTQQFLVRFDPQGLGAADLSYGTYYGGPQPVTPYVLGFGVDLVFDADDVVTLTGDTSSPSFPATRCAIDTDYNEPPQGEIQWGDAFAARFDLQGQGDSDLLYMTYLGGQDQDRGLGIVQATNEAFTLGGYTSSGDFPITPGSYDDMLEGDVDAMLARVDLCAICSNYCESTVNSTGFAARMDFEGSTSVAADDLELVAAPVPNQPGIFFFGPNAIQAPFGNGFRCVGGGIVRTGVSVGSNSELRFAVDYSQYDELVAGSSWNFQTWYRDPAGGGSRFNLSDGLNIVFCP